MHVLHPLVAVPWRVRVVAKRGWELLSVRPRPHADGISDKLSFITTELHQLAVNREQ
jgi:hypothetical protein